MLVKLENIMVTGQQLVIQSVQTMQPITLVLLMV
jgi:hypothetical protein